MVRGHPLVKSTALLDYSKYNDDKTQFTPSSTSTKQARSKLGLGSMTSTAYKTCYFFSKKKVTYLYYELSSCGILDQFPSWKSGCKVSKLMALRFHPSALFHGPWDGPHHRTVYCNVYIGSALVNLWLKKQKQNKTKKKTTSIE